MELFFFVINNWFLNVSIKRISSLHRHHPSSAFFLSVAASSLHQVLSSSNIGMQDIDMYEPSGQGRSSLYVAIENGCSMELIEKLIEAAPNLISLRDKASSLYPFQMAACSKSSSVESIFVILRKQPDVLRVVTSD